MISHRWEICCCMSLWGFFVAITALTWTSPVADIVSLLVWLMKTAWWLIDSWSEGELYTSYQSLACSHACMSHKIGSTWWFDPKSFKIIHLTDRKKTEWVKVNCIKRRNGWWNRTERVKDKEWWFPGRCCSPLNTQFSKDHTHWNCSSDEKTQQLTISFVSLSDIWTVKLIWSIEMILIDWLLKWGAAVRRISC